MKVDPLDLIERIYATALLPHDDPAWEALFIGLERHFVGARSILILKDSRAKSVNFVHAPSLEPNMVELYNQHYAWVNPWWEATEARAEGSVHSAEMLLPQTELSRSEFYADWLRPQGLHTGGGCTILKGNGRLMAFTFLKEKAHESVTQSEFSLMRVLLPHFQRAAKMRRQFGQVELKSAWATDSLDMLNVGVVLIQLPRNVVFMNQLATNIIRQGEHLFLNAKGAIHARATADDIRLAKAIESAALSRRYGTDPEDDVLTIAGSEQAEPLSILVTSFGPLYDLPHERGRYLTLFISPQGRLPRARVDRLITLYGFTRAEARVLSKLVAGMDMRQIALSQRVSLNTIRNQMQCLFEKTGTHRQSELIARVISDLATLPAAIMLE